MRGIQYLCKTSFSRTNGFTLTRETTHASCVALFSSLFVVANSHLGALSFSLPHCQSSSKTQHSLSVVCFYLLPFVSFRFVHNDFSRSNDNVISNSFHSGGCCFFLPASTLERRKGVDSIFDVLLFSLLDDDENQAFLLMDYLSQSDWSSR